MHSAQARWESTCWLPRSGEEGFLLLLYCRVPSPAGAMLTSLQDWGGAATHSGRKQEAPEVPRMEHKGLSSPEGEEPQPALHTRAPLSPQHHPAQDSSMSTDMETFLSSNHLPLIYKNRK